MPAASFAKAHGAALSHWMYQQGYTSNQNPVTANLMILCINPHCQKPQNLDTQLFCQNCGSELLLQGSYRVMQLLGAGGFGKTYEVSDRGTPKVLKVLLLNDPKAVSLFQQEAQVLSQLNHPGIPKADGYFTFLPKNSQEPLHCLIMEKIEGLDLQEYLERLGKRPIDQKLAIAWLTELANILQEVHNQNFFHRDIKPSNIMLKAAGQLALIDFGTARGVTGTYRAKVAAGQKITGILSTGYTPPEQINGYAELRSDFFALGRTFVYLLTGKEPNDFYDPDTDECRWRNSVPHVSSLLADFIDQLMARLPGQRPQNAQVILQRLAEINNALQPPQAISIPNQPVTTPGVAPTQSVKTPQTTLSSISPPQAPPAVQQAIPTPHVNPIAPQVNSQAIPHPRSTSQNKSRWLIRIGTGIAAVLAVVVGIYNSSRQPISTPSKTPEESQNQSSPKVSASANSPPVSASANSPPVSASTSSPPVSASTSSPQETDLPRLEGKATVVMIVKGAPITIEVDGKNAPITAGNFVDLVQRGVYNGLVFHQVVREPLPFVIQGGDPQGKDPNFPVERLGTGGYIDPATSQERYIPLEIKPKGAQTPIYSKTFNQAGLSVPPELRHTRGAVAQARPSKPDSASSQFYIALAELTFLDGDYAVFGYVTKGMDVVDKIRRGDRIESATVTQGLENLKTIKIEELLKGQ